MSCKIDNEKAVETAKKMLLSGKLTTEDIAPPSGICLTNKFDSSF